MSSLDNVNTCGTTEIVIFVLTVIFGTANGVLAKVLMSVTGTDDEDGSPRTESFDKPLFLTSAMFVGMLLVLPMHWVVSIFKLNFPGYEFDNDEEVIQNDKGSPDHLEEAQKSTPDLDSTQMSTMHLYFILIIPAVCDLVATAMFMIGLQYLDVSI